MGSHRLSRVELDGLEVMGYSVGGVETVVGIPSLNVCFDIGKAPDQLLSIDHILLSHGHMDHAAGIAYYLSQRDFREMAPGRVLLHESLAGALTSLLDSWGRLDGSRPPADIVPLLPGQEYELRRNLFVFPFETGHCLGSLGFTVIERRQKLKPEYHELPGPEIAKLRKNGEQVTYPMNMPLVSYLGDTMGGEFEELAVVQHSRVLIAECTFFDDDHHKRAKAGRHYHVDHLAEWLTTVKAERILLTHVTRRTDLAEAKKAITKRLPPEVNARVRFLMDRPRRPRKKTDKQP